MSRDEFAAAEKRIAEQCRALRLEMAERCRTTARPGIFTDGEIEQALSAPSTMQWYNGGNHWLINRRGTAMNPSWERYRPDPVSLSIDAAVELVPTWGFDAPWSWRVGNLSGGPDGKGPRGFATLGTSTKIHEARTPALALAAACLEAWAEEPRKFK